MKKTLLRLVMAAAEAAAIAIGSIIVHEVYAAMKRPTR